VSNTVHKIRDVDQFLHVLETAQAQGMHVKLGRFGRSLVVTPLPMKNGVPADKRISQDQAAVARKLNQLVQRELVRAGAGRICVGPAGAARQRKPCDARCRLRIRWHLGAF